MQRGGFHFALICRVMCLLNTYSIQTHQVSNAGERKEAQEYCLGHFLTRCHHHWHL